MPQCATQRLKDSTRALHDQIEASPFAKAFLHKELPLQSYAGYLRFMASLHGCVECMLAHSDEARVKAVWSQNYSRLPALLEDFLWLRPKLIPDSNGLIRAMLASLSHIRLVAQEDPMGLLGCVYVLWGSTKGAVTLAPLARKTHALEQGKGLSYLTQHATSGAAQWEALAPALDQALDSETAFQSSEKAAVALFKHIQEAFEQLFPVDTNDLTYHVLALNPYGGSHEMPQDPKAITALQRASDRCLAEFPYFISRFGLRGYLFSDSDGAWLATLPGEGEATMMRNVQWLRGVLSSRGIPGYLLQRHLEFLIKELERAEAAPPEHLALLSTCVQDMEGQWQTTLPQGERERLLTQFEEASSVTAIAREAGVLALSAVVDEAHGIQGAVQGLMEYYGDGRIFSEPFKKAVLDLIDASRQVVGTTSSQDS